MKAIDFVLNFTAKTTAVTKAVSKMTGDMDKAEKQAEKLSGTLGKVGKSLKDAVMSLPGAGFFTNPFIATGLGLAKVIQLGSEAEKTATSFNVLLGSETAAADMLDKIGKYAASTPLSKLDLQNNAKTMLSFGISADKTFESLKMLGDISGGDAEKLNSLSLAFSQATAAGKLQGQDLMQLIGQGWNPLADIAAMTGKTLGEVKEQMSKGAITSDMLFAALQHATGEGGKFNGMLEKLSQTTGGRLSTLADHFTTLLTNIFEKIQPLVNTAVTALDAVVQNGLVPLLNLLSSLAGWLSTLSPLIAGLAAAWAAYNACILVSTAVLKGWTIASLAQFYALLALEKAQQLVNLAMSLNPVGLVIAGIAALVAVIAVCWNKFAGFRAVVLTAWDTLKGFGNIIKTFVVDRITDLLSGLGDIGKAFKLLFEGEFSKAADVASKSLGKLTGANAAKKAFEAGTNLAKGVSKGYSEHLKIENAKQARKKGGISAPSLAGSPAASLATTPNTLGQSDKGKQTAESVATGGTRSTSVYVNIAKLIETMNTYKTESESNEDFYDRVVEAVVRAVNIGTAAAR